MYFLFFFVILSLIFLSFYNQKILLLFCYRIGGLYEFTQLKLRLAVTANEVFLTLLNQKLQWLLFMSTIFSSSLALYPFVFSLIKVT
jgi:hypothetical protein